MDYKIVELNEIEVEALEDSLEDYDNKHIGEIIEGEVSIGIKDGDYLVAGLNGVVTSFNILYVPTVFVLEDYRRKGYGSALIKEMEKRAKAMAINTIRLDTFDFQGYEFYKALGYKEVGHYKNEEDGYEEFFFMKRI